jgi:hypothetical protein
MIFRADFRGSPCSTGIVVFSFFCCAARSNIGCSAVFSSFFVAQRAATLVVHLTAPLAMPIAVQYVAAAVLYN